jgi:hypothetical protein
VKWTGMKRDGILNILSENISEPLTRNIILNSRPMYILPVIKNGVSKKYLGYCRLRLQSSKDGFKYYMLGFLSVWRSGTAGLNVFISFAVTARRE